MSKTVELRNIIQSNITNIIERCYYRVADEEAAFPYAVYDFENIDLGDIARDDLILLIDLWDQSIDSTTIENIADEIEDLFNAANIPNEYVLPTFYRVSRKTIDDPDKTLIRRQLKFQIQNYKNGGN